MTGVDVGILEDASGKRAEVEARHVVLRDQQKGIVDEIETQEHRDY